MSKITETRLEKFVKDNPMAADEIGASEAVAELRRMRKREAEWADCIERLASSAYRLEQMAGGAEVEEGDMLFQCKEGTYCEQIAQQRIRALLAIKEKVTAK
jgi:hypothetical protein